MYHRYKFYGVLCSHNTNFMIKEFRNAKYDTSVNGCFTLRNSLILYFNKKKIYASWLIAEVEYGETRNSYSQLIWMKYVLKKYNVKQDVMTLYCVINGKAVTLVHVESEK